MPFSQYGTKKQEERGFFAYRVHATWTLSSLSELLMPQAADELRTVNMHYSLIRPI